MYQSPAPTSSATNSLVNNFDRGMRGSESMEKAEKLFAFLSPGVNFYCLRTSGPSRKNVSAVTPIPFITLGKCATATTGLVETGHYPPPFRQGPGSQRNAEHPVSKNHRSEPRHYASHPPLAPRPSRRFQWGGLTGTGRLLPAQFQHGRTQRHPYECA